MLGKALRICKVLSGIFKVPGECVCILCLCCTDRLIGRSFGREGRQGLSARLLKCTVVPELARYVWGRCWASRARTVALSGPLGLATGIPTKALGFPHPTGLEAPYSLSLSSLCPQPSRFKNMKLVEQAEVPRILSAESALESARVFGSVLVPSSFSLQSMERTVLDVLPCALNLLCCQLLPDPLSPQPASLPGC